MICEYSFEIQLFYYHSSTSYAVVALALLLLLVAMVARRVAATEAPDAKPTSATFAAYNATGSHRCHLKQRA